MNRSILPLVAHPAPRAESPVRDKVIYNELEGNKDTHKLLLNKLKHLEVKLVHKEQNIKCFPNIKYNRQILDLVSRPYDVFLVLT